MAAEPLPLQRRRSPLIGALTLLPLLLAGCSGTRFGEALSRSFPGTSGTVAGSPAPSPPPASGIPGEGGVPVNPASPAEGPSETRGAPPGSVAPAATGTVAAAGAGATSARADGTKPGGAGVPGIPPATGRAGKAGATGQAAPQRPAVPPPANPAPYRVTIRLPQADPSAPAEVVTEALRAAGVPFEVETIERMGGAATTTPAAAPASPAAPLVRPAPPPR